jgi:hypothetical protein
MLGVDQNQFTRSMMPDAYSIPDSYFNNFDEFQGEFNNTDFSYGVQSIESVENMGEDIGLGGEFV